MSVPVGLTVPKLLPITGSFALPFGAYYVYLQSRVVYNRLSTKTLIGDNAEKGGNDPVFLATRAHANFAENVPIVLLLAGIAELNGGSRKALTTALSALLVARICHADFGILTGNTGAVGRPVGYYGTQAIFLGLAGYATYLVKGYWGL